MVRVLFAPLPAPSYCAHFYAIPLHGICATAGEGPLCLREISIALSRAAFNEQASYMAILADCICRSYTATAWWPGLLGRSALVRCFLAARKDYLNDMIM
jgi:hypothetical protein